MGGSSRDTWRKVENSDSCARIQFQACEISEFEAEALTEALAAERCFLDIFINKTHSIFRIFDFLNIITFMFCQYPYFHLVIKTFNILFGNIILIQRIKTIRLYTSFNVSILRDLTISITLRVYLSPYSGI